MDDDTQPVTTTRLSFGQKVAEQPVEAQQDETVAVSEAQTETTEALPVDAQEEQPVDAACVAQPLTEAEPVPVVMAEEAPTAEEIITESISDPEVVEETLEDHAENVAVETAVSDAVPVAEDEPSEAEAVVETPAEPVAVEDTASNDEAVVSASPATATSEPAKSVEELQAERQKLDDEINSKRNAEKASVIAQIKSVADTYGVTPDEIVEAMGGLRSKRKGVKAKPKYRNPATGVVWSGRGKEPAWIKGQDRNQFLITD